MVSSTISSQKLELGRLWEETGVGCLDMPPLNGLGSDYPTTGGFCGLGTARFSLFCPNKKPPSHSRLEGGGPATVPWRKSVRSLPRPLVKSRICRGVREATSLRPIAMSALGQKQTCAVH